MRFFLLFTFFFQINSFSQIDSVEVNYKVIIGNDDLMAKDKVMTKTLELAIEGSVFLEFKLFANKKESYFLINSSLENQSNSIVYAKIHSGFTSDLYSDDKNGFVYENHNDVLGEYVLKKKLQVLDWTLTNETKNIGGLKCYKATADEIVINPVGKFYYPITAWYSPEIPISKGPLLIGGLPGLIIELSRRNVVFGLKSFEINPIKIIPLKKPKFNKVKTIEEVNKMKYEFINGKE